MSDGTPTFAVDRVTGSSVVLIADSDGREVHVDAGGLPAAVRVGAVVRVTSLADGRPDWPSAAIDEEETVRRLRQAEETLERLRRRDPGGDVVL